MVLLILGQKERSKEKVVLYFQLQSLSRRKNWEPLRKPRSLQAGWPPACLGSSRSLEGDLIPNSAATFPSWIAAVITHLPLIPVPFIICILYISYSFKAGVVYFLGRKEKRLYGWAYASLHAKVLLLLSCSWCWWSSAGFRGLLVSAQVGMPQPRGCWENVSVTHYISLKPWKKNITADH